MACAIRADFRQEEKFESVSPPENMMLPQTCGNVLLAVCRHSETLERLYSALQGPNVDVS